MAFSETLNFKILWGSMPPDPPSLGHLAVCPCPPSLHTSQPQNLFIPTAHFSYRMCIVLKNLNLKKHTVSLKKKFNQVLVKLFLLLGI